MRHRMPVVGHRELDERRRHRREVVVALHVEIPHPVRQWTGLRPRTVGEERARGTRPSGTVRLGLNGSAQPLQERSDFPVQLMVLHTVLSSVPRTILVSRAVDFSNCALLLIQPLNRIAGTNAGKTMEGKTIVRRDAGLLQIVNLSILVAWLNPAQRKAVVRIPPSS